MPAEQRTQAAKTHDHEHASTALPDLPPSSKPQGLSRRGFIKGAVATIAGGWAMGLLPKVEGGFLAPAYNAAAPTEALAQAFQEGNVTYELVIVTEYQVGVQVVDVTNASPDKDPVPVPGASVTLVSQFKDAKLKTQTKETGDDGKVIFDISKMSETDDKGNPIDGQYQFNGTIYVKFSEGSKMRDFSCGMIRVEGASGFSIPTRQLKDDDITYAERITFDGWDLHYSDNTFFRGEDNTYTHTFEVRLVGVKKEDADKVKVTLKDADGKIWGKDGISGDVKYDDDADIALCTITGLFLHKGEDVCVVQDETNIICSWTYAKKDFTVPVVLKSEEAPLQSDGAKEVTLLPMFTDPDQGISAHFPTGLPYFSAIDFSVWTPRLPFQVQFSPTNVMLGIGADSFLASDDGVRNPNGWKYNPKDYFVKGYKRKFNKQWNEIKDTITNKGWVNQKTGLLDTHHFSHNFDASVHIQGVLGFDWEGLEEEYLQVFKGSLTASANLSLALTLTESFMAGPVPLFVSLVLDMMAASALTLSTRATTTKENPHTLPYKQTKWSLDEFDPITINLKMGFTLSAGVGISGVLSLGISGSPHISIFIGFVSTKAILEDKADPHVVVGFEFKCEVFVQLFIFKLSATIWSWSDDHCYDNWPPDQANDSTLITGEDVWEENESRFALTQADGSRRHTLVYRNSSDENPINLDGLMDTPSLYKSLVVVQNDELSASIEADCEITDEDAKVDPADLPTLHPNKTIRLRVKEDGSLGAFLVDSPGNCAFTTDGAKIDETTGEILDADATLEAEAAAEEPEEQTQDEQTAATQVAPQPEAAQDETTEANMPLAAEATVATAAEPENATTPVPDTTAAATDEEPSTNVVAQEAAVDADATLVPLAQTDDAAASSSADELVVEAASITETAAVASAVEVSTTDEPAVATAAQATSAEEATSSNQPPSQTEDEPQQEAPRQDAQLDAQANQTVPQRDRFFGLGGPVPKVRRYTPRHSATGNSCEFMGFNGLEMRAKHGGIKPTVDVVTHKNVFSDPRQKVVVIAGTTYLFRIITVQEDGVDVRCRSRLAACAYDKGSNSWGDPQVIFCGDAVDKDGNVVYTRGQVYDYDFDIITRPDDASWYEDSMACIIMTGGVRPSGDSSDVFSVFTSPTVSVLFLNGSLETVHWSSCPADAYLGKDMKHMVMSPRVIDYCAVGKQHLSGVFTFAFIHRSAKNADDIMSDDPDVAQVSFTVGYCHALPHACSFEAKPLATVQLDPSVTSLDMVLGKPVENEADLVVAMLFRYKNGYDVYSGYLPQDQAFDKFAVKRNVHSESPLPGAVVWPNHGCFLFTNTTSLDDKVAHLYYGSYDFDTIDASALTPMQIDLEGFNGGTFGVSPTGNYLYFIDSREGNQGDDVDLSTGEHTKDKDPVVRIRASKLIGDSFCADFPFCELSHPIDSLVPMTFDEDASTFIASEIIGVETKTGGAPITDNSYGANNSLAYMHYISVKHALVSEVEDFKPIDPFVCAGHYCDFQVTVRNQGNVVISGFDLQLIDDSTGDVVETQLVGKKDDADDAQRRLEPEKMILTTYNYDREATAANGGEPVFRLSDPLQGGELMPGKPVTYSVTFMIPKEWGAGDMSDEERKRTVRMQIAKSYASDKDPTSELVAMAEGAVPTVLTLEGLGVDRELTIHAASNTEAFHDPAETVKDHSNGGGGNNGGGNNGGGNNGGGNNGGGALPRTSDLSALAGPLPLALGGLGAALAAYGKRVEMIAREDMERTQREQEAERE